MNKKGFTLVELIGVLVIIGLLLLVTATPILGQIRNQKDKLDDATSKVLYASASSYLDEHANNYPKKDGMIYYLSVKQLVNDGYLKENYLEASELLEETSAISITINNGSYSFDFISESSSIGSVYEKIAKSVTNKYNYLGGTYFKGNVTNNYVYYSGITWRIMGINEDGSIRLVADEPVTTLFFANGIVNKFQDTYAYDWLNTYFVSRLNYNDIIVKTQWCDSAATGITSASDPCKDMNRETMKTGKVGLLSLDEYNLSKNSGATYIRGDINFITLTPNSSGSYYYIKAGSTPTVATTPKNSAQFIKPVINVKATTVVADDTVTGTSANPYLLNQSSEIIYRNTGENARQKKFADINLAPGEYVKLGTYVYRIVDSDKSSVKIIRDGYISTETIKYGGTDSTFNLSKGIGYQLNETLFSSVYTSYKKFIKASMWYQGDYGETSYKYTSLAKSNFIIGDTPGVPLDVKIGLPKVGELFTTPLTDGKEFWTMSASDITKLYTIKKDAINESLYTASLYVREVIILDGNSTVVSSGIGTSSKPYVVKVS